MVWRPLPMLEGFRLTTKKRVSETYRLICGIGSGQYAKNSTKRLSILRLLCLIILLRRSHLRILVNLIKDNKWIIWLWYQVQKMMIWDWTLLRYLSTTYTSLLRSTKSLWRKRSNSPQILAIQIYQQLQLITYNNRKSWRDRVHHQLIQ